MSRSNQPLDANLTIDPFAIASFTGPDNHTGLFLDADQVNSSVLLRTNDTNAIYVDKFQNIGINTISPAAQLDINAADGKCVQLTYNGSSNKASLHVASDGKLALIASGGEVSIDAASDFNIKSHDGSSIGLKLNGTLVHASADQINYNVVTPGTAAASKAIVLDSSRDITNIRNLTASQLTGTIQTVSQPNITSVATLDITAHDGSQGLALGGALLTATAAQLNYNVVTPGTTSASKALVVDANKDITSIRYLTATQLTGTLQTAAQPNITSVGTLLGLDIDGSFTGLATLGIATTTAGRTLVVNSDVGNCIQLCYNTTSGTASTYVDMLVSSTGDLTVTASGGNVNISSHNGTDKGLKLGGTLVVSTADQINYLSGSTPGTASSGKALIFDSSRNVDNINNLTAIQLTGTLQTAAQPNINSVNVLNIANHNGSTIGLRLNSTLVTATATELNYVDTTPGTAEASKALVLDSSSNIAGINTLSATELTGAIQTAAQTNITSVGTLSNIATSGTFTMGTTVISESEIGVIDAVTPGTAAASKALVLDASSNISGINALSASELTGELQTAAQPNITSVGTLTSIATSGTFTMGTTVFSEAEIGVLDGVTPGTAAASKALVLDSNKDIATIRYLTATQLTGEIQTAAQPNITSVATLDITAHNGSTTGLYLGGALVTATAAQINSIFGGGGGAGSFEDLTVNGWVDIANANGTTIGLKLDGTLVTATANELNYVDTTPGTAAASKALVLDSSSNISGINSLSATELTGAIQTAAQPTITSLGTLTSLGVSSATSTNTFTSSWSSANNNTITLANTGNGFAGGINITGFNGSGVAKNVIRFAPVYGTTTSGSETTGCNFYALAAGTEYTPFQILSTGGCKVARASANGNVLAIGGAISSANQYGDLAFEGTGVTLLRQRAIYVDANTSKMELYGRSGGADALMTTFAYGTSGGVLTSLESVTSGKLISTIGSSGIGLQHINSSISLATIIDSSNTRGCFGTTTGHDVYLFTNNRSTNPSLILETYTNFVKINTNITGSSGALGASLGVRGGIQNNCDTITLNTSTGTCLLGSTALTSPYAVNPWLASQLAPFNTPTSLGFGSMQQGQLFIEAGYFTSTYTETYTFTVTYVHTFYKIWVNGKLRGNNLSINSSSTNTQTFTLALIASTRNSIYIQILPQNAAGGSCSLSVLYQSARQSSTTVPINASNGTEKYISTEPLSCPSVFTIYDQITASSALLKSELTTNSSGNLNIFASGLTTLIDSTNSFDIAGHNGTTIGLKLGGTLVTATAEQLDYTTASPGTASANKALVVDGNKDIASINSLVAAQLTGAIQTAAQPNITSVGTLSGITTSGTFTMGTTAISEAEIGVIDAVTPGTATASKALVLDSSSDISGINSLSATELTGAIQTAAQPNVTSVGTLTSITTSGTFTMGATGISEAEIGVLDGVTPGTATASKALVLDANKDIATIRYLTATQLTGEIQTAAQPNITSVGTLTDLVVAGDLECNGNLIIGGTIIAETEIVHLDGAIPGTAEALKAMITDADNDIAGINSFSATSLTGTIQTASQPNITSVSTLDITGHNGTSAGLKLGGVLVTATASQLNSIVSGSSSSSFIALTAADTITITNANGVDKGLVLGSTLVLTSAAQLNYNVVTPGTASASKALVLDSSSNISGINSLSATELTGELQTAAQPNVTSVGTLTSITTSGAFTMGTTGISEAEIGVLDGVTPGTAVASKALVLDANKDIATIRFLTATQLTGEIQTAAQPNITSVGTLTSITTSGSLTMGSTGISEAEIGVLDGVTPGTATASKALVLNGSKGISGITSLASTSIVVGSPANSNLPVEIGYTTYTFTGSYAYSNDVNSHGMVDAGNGSSANYSLRADGRILVTGEVEITSDRRLKKDIVALTPELCKSFILTTTPVRFNWKSDDTIPDYGYIAQDVLKAGFNDLVTVVPQPDMEGSVDDDGFINPAGAKYVFSPGKIIPMVALNQRQLFEANDAKDVEIADLKERLSALESLVSQLLQK